MRSVSTGQAKRALLAQHAPLMNRLRLRIGDKRVLALTKAFLKAGVLTTVGTRPCR